MPYSLLVYPVFQQLLDFTILLLIEQCLSLDYQAIHLLVQILLSFDVERARLHCGLIVFPYLTIGLIQRQMCISASLMFAKAFHGLV